LRKKFLDFKLGIRHPLADVLRIDELNGIWQKTNWFDDLIEAIPAVLPVGAVAFPPVVTIDESGKADGIQEMDHLQFTDLFSHGLLEP
jgi:hypothetical protein